jgi:lipoate-protein ligase A
MNLLTFDRSFSSPAEQLACDEALLDYAEAREGTGFLRFWESTLPFVVLGYAKRAAAEVFEEECAALKIPVLRRASGGGTVLQGPGCFNYTLVLPIRSHPRLESISGTNCYVMQQQAAATTKAVGQPIQIQGFTDLTARGRKFSGNAQRRKRRCLLFHGSFLLNFDLSLVARALRNPVDQPEYREKRNHSEFIVNLPASASALQKAIIEIWLPDGPASPVITGEIAAATARLVEEKYARDDWNRRF